MIDKNGFRIYLSRILIIANKTNFPKPPANSRHKQLAERLRGLVDQVVSQKCGGGCHTVSVAAEAGGFASRKGTRGNHARGAPGYTDWAKGAHPGPGQVPPCTIRGVGPGVGQATFKNCKGGGRL